MTIPDRKCGITPKCIDDLIPTKLISACISLANNPDDKNNNVDNPTKRIEPAKSNYDIIPVYRCEMCGSYYISSEKKMEPDLNIAVMDYLKHRPSGFSNMITGIKLIGPGSESVDTTDYKK